MEFTRTHKEQPFEKLTPSLTEQETDNLRTEASERMSSLGIVKRSHEDIKIKLEKLKVKSKNRYQIIEENWTKAGDDSAIFASTGETKIH